MPCVCATAPVRSTLASLPSALPCPPTLAQKRTSRTVRTAPAARSSAALARTKESSCAPTWIPRGAQTTRRLAATESWWSVTDARRTTTHTERRDARGNRGVAVPDDASHGRSTRRPQGQQHATRGAHSRKAAAQQIDTCVSHCGAQRVEAQAIAVVLQPLPRTLAAARRSEVVGDHLVQSHFEALRRRCGGQLWGAHWCTPVGTRSPSPAGLIRSLWLRWRWATTARHHD